MRYNVNAKGNCVKIMYFHDFDYKSEGKLILENTLQKVPCNTSKKLIKFKSKPDITLL